MSLLNSTLLTGLPATVQSAVRAALQPALLAQGSNKSRSPELDALPAVSALGAGEPAALAAQGTPPTAEKAKPVALAPSSVDAQFPPKISTPALQDAIKAALPAASAAAQFPSAAQLAAMRTAAGKALPAAQPAKVQEGSAKSGPPAQQAAAEGDGSTHPAKALSAARDNTMLLGDAARLDPTCSDRFKAPSVPCNGSPQRAGTSCSSPACQHSMCNS